MWTVRNLALFREMIKTQKIMSPAFPAGECSLRLSVYQSTVAGADFLSLCLESKVFIQLLPSWSLAGRIQSSIHGMLPVRQ